ncbi:MAG: rhodanese-like domain-containing protein [Flavobacteriaceae bacterium]|nr:rhodanese-like domain-containing protein [Flavobacteriaceae bacterium]
MMFTTRILISLLFFPLGLFAQKSIDAALKKYNKGDIPYISIDSLQKRLSKNQIVLLDAREKQETSVSTLPNAFHIGFEDFEMSKLEELSIDKQASIVVYCSIGVRSEAIARKIKAAGYAEVYNLYGGIFEWINQENTVVNARQQPTDSVHAFSKFWAKFLTRGTKVYE